MDLGENFPCLNVKNLEESIAFYEKLDFKMIKDHRDENWAWMQQRLWPCWVSLTPTPRSH